MSDTGSQDGRRGGKSAEDEAALSERLRSLGRKLDEVQEAAQRSSTAEPPAPMGMQGLGLAVRVASEFVAGVLVGAGLGWLFDHFLGTSPWGLIVFLLLGFVAGVVNVLRAVGRMAQPEARRK
jgi:ATP synthase protein I